ncbi:MAG: hypothetical protein Q8L04_15850 [Ignavibacteria bacterium]|nr:hypothetical protein [Ignavibacteria bacterium]
MKTKVLIVVLIMPFILLVGCKSEKEKMLSLGDERFMSGDFKGAAAIYAELKGLHPDYLLAYIRLADCELCLSKNYPTFLESLTQASLPDEEFVSLVKKKFSSYKSELYSITEEERRNKLLGYSNEIEFFTEAIEKNENNPTFYFARGMWNSILDEPEKALKDLKMAIKINPNFLKAKLMQARVYSGYYKNRRGNFKALNIYMEALNSNPNNEELIIETAFCLGSVGQSQTALKMVEGAYLKDTSKTNLLKQLVWLNRIAGRIIAANKYAERLVKKFPNDKMYWENYAQLLIEVGEFDNGIKILKKIQKMVKDDKFESLRIQGMIDVNTINRKKM